MQSMKHRRAYYAEGIIRCAASRTRPNPVDEESGVWKCKNMHMLLQQLHNWEDLVSDTTANPAGLGLAGFGLTTVLLSSINAGLLPAGGEPVVIPLAMAFGGTAQIIAGLMEFGWATFSAPLLSALTAHSGGGSRCWCC
jgi:hypothetical protein